MKFGRSGKEHIYSNIFSLFFLFCLALLVSYVKGIKYLVAVRPDCADALLPSLLPLCLQGLDDEDDEVRAASAEALYPMAESLSSRIADEVRNNCR